MKNVIFLFMFFAALQLDAQTYNGPESVEYDYANSRWLISNTVSHQVLARSSNGTLTVFATGFSSGPHGIEIVGDTLFCCSGGSIKGFALATGTQVFNLALGATFLNGITHDNAGNIYTTDFNAKKIYKVHIATQTDTIIATGLPQSPNGIIYDAANNRCVFVNWGSNAPIKAIDLTTFVVSTLTTTTLTNCDGIAVDGQNNFYVSTWGTQSIKKYNSSFTGTAVTVGTGLNNPADIFYNVTGDTLGIPNAGNNTVTFIGFTPTGINQPVSEAIFNITPNPVKQNALVVFHLNKPASTTIDLYDASGKFISSVFNSDKALVSEKSFEWERTNLKAGVYFLKLNADGNTISRKIIFE